ncbi:DedA family protein [Actinoplanes bogorensis]|uniref:DedA family protein n=1 Tax=Paractinoplanes bogorensis TaxID=1610840 RepID=A0ABS5YX15_9ACTN|nr:DedA family protein [Actinoplanes bogorensis]MBU2667977.1 DedA family protein [Actinoplanes bogorensis]
MTHLIDLIAAVPPWLTYLLIGLLAFGEAAAFVGLVLPGETALIVGGVLAATGHISLPVLLVLAVLAAVAGDSVGYEIGRHGGPAIMSSRAGRFVGAKRWAAAEAFTRRHGGWSVFLGRWVGLARALTPALAGMTRMPYRKFLLFNATGGILWSVAVVLAGYFAGASWPHVSALLGNVTYVVVAAVLILLAVKYRKRLSPYVRPVLAAAALTAVLAAGAAPIVVPRWPAETSEVAQPGSVDPAGPAG